MRPSHGCLPPIMQIEYRNAANHLNMRLGAASGMPARVGLAACLGVLLLLAAGCQSTGGKPAPIMERSTNARGAAEALPSGAEQPRHAGTVGELSDAMPAEPEPEPTPSVALALVDQADRFEQEGDPLRAEASLERAIRIDPQNGALWMRLAEAQLASGKHETAEQTARKSLLFLPEMGSDTRRAWLIIADAREAQGDPKEARSIRRKWRSRRGLAQ